MLLNYHIGRHVLGSLCVGDSMWLGWSGIRIAGFSRDLPTCSAVSQPPLVMYQAFIYQHVSYSYEDKIADNAMFHVMSTLNPEIFKECRTK